MLKIPHCIDNRLTDGGKVVSPTHWPRSTSQKHYYFYVSVSGTHFCWMLNIYNVGIYHININKRTKVLQQSKII
jgi:hypothetical protein